VELAFFLRQIVIRHPQDYAYRLTGDVAVRMNVALCAETRVSENQSQSLVAEVAEMDRTVSIRRLVAAAGDCPAEAQRH